MDKEETSPTNGKIDEKINKNNNEEGNGKIEAVHLIAGKEEELVLPALEEYVVSSTSTTSNTIGIFKYYWFWFLKMSAKVVHKCFTGSIVHCLLYLVQG